MPERKRKDVSPEVCRLRGRIGLLQAAGFPPEEVEAVRRALAEELFESRLRKLIRDAPPLPKDRRARCAALIMAGSPGIPSA